MANLIDESLANEVTVEYTPRERATYERLVSVFSEEVVKHFEKHNFKAFSMLVKSMAEKN